MKDYLIDIPVAKNINDKLRKEMNEIIKEYIFNNDRNSTFEEKLYALFQSNETSNPAADMKSTKNKVISILEGNYRHFENIMLENNKPQVYKILMNSDQGSKNIDLIEEAVKKYEENSDTNIKIDQVYHGELIQGYKYITAQIGYEWDMDLSDGRTNIDIGIMRDISEFEELMFNMINSELLDEISEIKDIDKEISLAKAEVKRLEALKLKQSELISKKENLLKQ
jgi:hypothetical protein